MKMVNVSSVTKRTLIPLTVVGALVLLYKFLKSRKQLIFFRDSRSKEIVVVNTAADWESVYPKLCRQCETVKAVGLDCEWVFGGHRFPVSLLQISTHEGLCLLVRLCSLKDEIPETLKSFLADRRILKLGVAVRDDGKKLFKDYGLVVQGCVDLRHIVARIRGLSVYQESLQGLAESVLQVQMKKDKAVRCGDWEAETLSSAQVEYAADDALIAVDIFMQLVTFKLCGIEKRRQFYGSYISSDITSFWKTAASLCQGVLDVPYKKTKNCCPYTAQQGQSSRTLEDHDGDETSSLYSRDFYLRTDPGTSEEGAPYDDECILGTDLKKKTGHHKNGQKAFMTRQRPLYYNCIIEAPDGESLTTCDKRKAEWYLHKELAVKVSDDPLVVRLKFEPSKRPTSDQDYYLQTKDNVCVVCGTDKDYVRKIVVPQEYRKHFPTILKDHSSHDVLLLCITCHLASTQYDDALKQQLAVECDAPLESGKSTRTWLDQDLSKVVSAARALLRNRSRIPEKRLLELEGLVKNYYGVSSLSQELLTEASEIDVKQANPDFTPHGKKVVQYYMSKEGGLLEFERMWRRQFVNIMKPKFMPAMWSIEHKPERMK